MTKTSTLAPLITYEGIEGAGKSTQMQEVAAYFTDKSLKTLVTREPGGTSIAEKIRAILIHPETEELNPKTEAYLMQAARVQHMQEVIAPGRQNCDLILCDRFVDSSTAYQGCARNLGKAWIEQLNMFSTDQLLPTLTFFIDIPIELSLHRMQARRQQQQKQDRFESEHLAFYANVRQAYVELAEQNPTRFYRLNGELSKQALVEQQIAIIENLLPA